MIRKGIAIAALNAMNSVTNNEFDWQLIEQHGYTLVSMRPSTLNAEQGSDVSFSDSKDTPYPE